MFQLEQRVMCEISRVLEKEDLIDCDDLKDFSVSDIECYKYGRRLSCDVNRPPFNWIIELLFLAFRHISLQWLDYRKSDFLNIYLIIFIRLYGFRSGVGVPRLLLALALFHLSQP
jgi:hypothetical protein